MNRSSAITFVRAIGKIAFIVAKNEREKTIRHLTWAFGAEKTQDEIMILAKRVFSNLSTCVADALRLPLLVQEGLDKLVSVEGMHHLTDHVNTGKGVLVQTGHYGNWELLGTWLASQKIPIRVVAKDTYDPRLDKLLVEYREQAGYASTHRGNTMNFIIESLKNGYVFGLLFDIDTKVKGTFVNFFGKPAHTAINPVLLAQRLNIPIVPIFIRLCDDLTYKITVQPPIPLVNTGNEAEDAQTNTQKCSDIYEKQIRKHPEQWIWMHERWKKQPT